ncbi:hypothetical protein [Alphabaculovirus myunipunctae]|uniref:Uncharacterized protein n=1 Tax=Mythimna unipuncta nucleopolyhedrovirus TaxID=447897 RepID=A0A2K9VSF9_9ABAC|nr:hypothetical protein [Mythimna unipuncta nucleopolyhedrovirus]AUV65393.1 hypothetical protein [Mythimna unipuncta nucleopolyhedrovirus]
MSNILKISLAADSLIYRLRCAANKIFQIELAFMFEEDDVPHLGGVDLKGELNEIAAHLDEIIAYIDKNVDDDATLERIQSSMTLNKIEREYAYEYKDYRVLPITKYVMCECKDCDVDTHYVLSMLNAKRKLVDELELRLERQLASRFVSSTMLF